MSKRALPGTEPITCKAMVAFGVNDLREEEIIVAPPKAGEVRVRVLCNALCHTDIYTLSGADPEGIFPSILGHEATAVVESVGEGVTSVAVGDTVVPGYTPQCKGADCIFCMSPKTNLCPKIRGTQGKGQMPDGTSRFTLKKDGSVISHFMGCSTFAEYTVLAEISCAKIATGLSPEKACLFGCGIATGLGAVWNTAKVEPFSSVAVFGLGAVGLAVVQAAKAIGATEIVGIDVNPKKFALATKLGCTKCVSPKDTDGKPMQQYLVGVSPTGFGFDYTFDCVRATTRSPRAHVPCPRLYAPSLAHAARRSLPARASAPAPLQTGNTDVMRSALEAAHRGWGKLTIIGVAASGKEIATRPFQFITGRHCTGTAFGGCECARIGRQPSLDPPAHSSRLTPCPKWFCSMRCARCMLPLSGKTRDAVPMLVNKAISGEIPLDHFITHQFKGVAGTKKAIEALHSGDCLRAVVTY